MDGLNTIYRDYGYNEENLFVVQITGSWISINYWANVNGVEYASVESTNGGSELSAAFSNPSDGTMLLVAPDRSYKGGLPERYGMSGGSATFEEILEDANIPKSGETSLDISGNRTVLPLFELAGSSIPELTMNQKGTASVALYSLRGRRIAVRNNVNVSVGTKMFLQEYQNAAPGFYLLEVRLNDVVQRVKISKR